MTSGWLISEWLPRSGLPCFLQAHLPNDELDIVTVLLHTTALRGNRWELSIPKPFLKPGAFHLQQMQTVSTVKLERRLGALNEEEMKRVRTTLAKRLALGV